MASSPAPLKGKLSQVKYLLDDADKRLQEKRSEYQIFTTQTSASGSSNSKQNGDQNIAADLIRTISDIGTLKSVLSCPIFNRIVNVTDSLDELSYHLNLHPSIGPSDINIDANGELILTPPFEPPSLNNFINSKLDDSSENSNNSPQIGANILVQNDTNNSGIILNNHQSVNQPHQSNNFDMFSEVGCSSNGFAKHEQIATNQQCHDIQQLVQNYVPSSSIISPLDSCDTEKLVSATSETYVNCNSKLSRHHDNKIDLVNNTEDGRRLCQSNGHITIDQDVPSSIELKSGYQSTQSMNQIGEHSHGSKRNGYSNELYKTTNELNQIDSMTLEHSDSRLNGQNLNLFGGDVQNHALNTNRKSSNVQSTGVQYNRGSCSPSTSAGSTVRLADDCDSGASSYQSQTAKGTPYSSIPYKTNDHIMETETVASKLNEDKVDCIEQALIDTISPEMAKIKVTLKKDKNSLGITIAGYTCETEEISGIFIKGIEPGGPADRSGKIRTLDQIFAVNGREILGYSNPEAVNVLRNTGNEVTLELMRYLAESKFQKLQTALSHAVPTTTTSSLLSDKLHNISAQSPTRIVSQSKSSIPISKARDSSSQPPTKQTSSLTIEPTFVQVLNGSRDASGYQPTESIYKNEPRPGNATNSPVKSPVNSYSSPVQDMQSHIPVAAQRGGTNKVIETKQGARNTIDIRSPVCQTSSAGYVKKAAELDLSSPANQSMTNRLQKEASDDLSYFIRSEKKPEWEKDAQIIEIYKDPSQGLGFTVKDYVDPKDPKQSIIMITNLTPGGVAERDGRLSPGDLLIFVDDTNLEGASLTETVKALKRTNGLVRLGVLKVRRN